jgi:flagellar biosynthetic protein FliO
VSDASLAVVLLRLVLAVAVVVGLLLLTARLTRRAGRGGAGSARGSIRVVARQPLGRNASVAVIETGGRTFVLGVTDHQVSLLGEHPIETATVDDSGPAMLPPAVGRRSLVDALRDRTLRKP